MKGKTIMKSELSVIGTCQAVQLAAMDVLGDLTSNPDLLNVPCYKELVERMYMAARQAACVSRVLGDEKTSRFTDDICEKILKLANL